MIALQIVEVVAIIATLLVVAYYTRETHLLRIQSEEQNRLAQQHLDHAKAVYEAEREQRELDRRKAKAAFRPSLVQKSAASIPGTLSSGTAIGFVNKGAEMRNIQAVSLTDAECSIEPKAVIARDGGGSIYFDRYRTEGGTPIELRYDDILGERSAIVVEIRNLSLFQLPDRPRSEYPPQDGAGDGT